MTEHAGTPIYYDPYDEQIDTDPHPLWRRMRDEQPLYWNAEHQFWVLTRFEDVWTAYRDPVRFSSSHGDQPETLDNPVDQPSMLFMDPPDHDALRRLVNRAFTPRRIAELETSIALLCAQLLDPMVGEPSFDYVAEFGAIVPPMVIGELLGVPEADRDMLRVLADQALSLKVDDEGTNPSAEAMATLAEYYVALIAERRASPQDDLLSALLSSELDGAERRPLTDQEVVAFVMLLNGAGGETTTRLFGWTAVLLARNPDQRELLVEDRSLTAGAVEELLRIEPPGAVIGRWVTKDTAFHGITVPAASKLLLINASANRDDREFEHPNQLDIRRAIKRTATFGYGAHYCLGAVLARTEGRLALEAMVDRFPRWEIDESDLEMVHTSTIRGYSSARVHVA